MNLVRDRWMFVPVGLLGLSVMTATLTVLLAVRGHSLGIEPDYYEKGQNWEATRAQMAMNERLGWVVTPDLGPGAQGHPHLALTIRDKHGVPIPAERVRVEAIPVRNADLRVSVDLALEREGAFGGDVPLRIGGQWEFRVRVERGDDSYTDTFRRTLEFARRQPAPAGGAGTP